MSARRLSRGGCLSSYLALLALLTLSALPAVAKAQTTGSAVLFYADKQVSESLWTPLFAAIQEDLASEDLGTASHLLTRSPRLLRSSELVTGEEFSNVIEVKLLGRCDVVQQAYRPLKPGPLGWVLRVQGAIQPYIYVDCSRIAQVLNPTTLGLSNDARTRAMSQAIAHVLVHEWIHIATQSTEHTPHGISEAQLTPSRLVTEPEPSHSTETVPEKPSSSDRGPAAEK